MATNLSRKDLDVAHHLDVARERGAENRLAERNARTRNDRIHAFHQRRVEGSERDRNGGVLEPHRSKGRRRRSRIGNTHPRAATREPTNTRKPGVSQPQNQDVLARPFIVHLPGCCQRSFNVDSPKSTSIIVMIQKRTTTWFSFQPFSS